MTTIIQPSLHTPFELVDIILDEVEAYGVNVHDLREEWDNCPEDVREEFWHEFVEDALSMLPDHYEVRLEPDLIVISEEGQE